MTGTRRVRHRTRTAVSALKDLVLGERPRDLLNQLTPSVTRCAWPGCRAEMQSPMPGGKTFENRYGVLCHVHAVDVAVAVVQHQTDQNQFMQFFERMSDERAIRVERWKREDEQYEAEKAKRRGDQEGFVYYIRIGERIKIGYSADVKRRMRAYPPGSELLATEPGDRALERKRHQQFAGSLADGREWFRPTPDIMELVHELVTTYGYPKPFAHHYRRNETPLRISRSA